MSRGILAAIVTFFSASLQVEISTIVRTYRKVKSKISVISAEVSLSEECLVTEKFSHLKYACVKFEDCRYREIVQSNISCRI